MIYFSSDLHLLHNRDFIYKARGFSTIEEMNKTILKNFNEMITSEDDLYLLGDTILGGPNTIDKGIELINKLNGKLHLVWGNHCTLNRQQALKEQCNNVIEIVGYAGMLRYKKWHFYMSHFPTNTTNFDDYKKPFKQRILNLHGHTHSKEKFNQYGSYNVAVDAHNCYPVSIDKIIEDFKNFYVDYVAIHYISEE